MLALWQSFENTRRTKHIDIRSHVIKDLISIILQIEYVGSKNNIADITKSLLTEKFKYLIRFDMLKIFTNIMVYDLSFVKV